jgi:hypothetical protein
VLSENTLLLFLRLVRTGIPMKPTADSQGTVGKAVVQAKSTFSPFCLPTCPPLLTLSSSSPAGLPTFSRGEEEGRTKALGSQHKKGQAT